MKKMMSLVLALSLFANAALSHPCPEAVKKAPVKKASRFPIEATAAPRVQPAKPCTTIVKITNVLPATRCVPMNPAVRTIFKHDTTVVTKGTSKKKVFGLMLLGAAAGFGIAKLTDDDRPLIVVGNKLPCDPKVSKPSKKTSTKPSCKKPSRKGK